MKMIRGRGGTGRRAALRSLWGKTRGSSSLLGRTKKLIGSYNEQRCDEHKKDTKSI